MSRGLIYIVFGESCERMAASTIAYSRQFTDLPICVVTNTKRISPAWDDIEDISFVEVKSGFTHNRRYKLRMNEYSPFDETLYLDADSVIQNEGIEKAFDLLEEHDMVMNLLLDWKVGDKIIRLYRTALRRTELTLPLKVFNGAFICFKNNQKTRDLFHLWYDNWVITGKGREMPALACAIKQSDVQVNCLPRGFFSPDYYNEDSIVQHNYTPRSKGGKNFFDRFDIPKERLYKGFDSDGTQNNWNWVYE